MIELETLELKNFMCVSHAALDFKEQQVVAFVGLAGQGKSAVMDAVCLCFSERKRADMYKNYVMLGETDAHVHLAAKVYGEPIGVELDISSAGQSSLARRVTFKGETRTGADAIALLASLDLPFYSDIMFSMQNQQSITELGPSARSEYLQKLLSFDFSDQLSALADKIAEDTGISDKARTVIGINTERSAQLSKEIKPDVQMPMDEAAFSSLKAEKDSLALRQSEIARVMQQNAAKQSAIVSAERGLSELRQRKAKRDADAESLKQRIDRYMADKASLEKSESDALSVQEALDAASKESAAAEDALEKANALKAEALSAHTAARLAYTRELDDLSRAEATRAESAKLRSELESIRKELSDIESKPASDCSAEVSAKELQYNDLRASAAEKKPELEHAKKHLDLVRAGKCPECGRDFDSADLPKYESAYNALLAESDALSARFRTCGSELTELRNRQKEESAERIASAARIQALRVSEAEKASRADAFDRQAAESKTKDQIDADGKSLDAAAEHLKDMETLASGASSSALLCSEKLSAAKSVKAVLDADAEKLRASVAEFEAAQKDCEAETGGTDFDAEIKRLEDSVRELSSGIAVIDAAESESIASRMKEIDSGMSQYSAALAAKAAVESGNSHIRSELEKLDAETKENSQTLKTAESRLSVELEAKTVLDKYLPNYMIVKTCAQLEKQMNDFINVVFPSWTVKLYQNKKGVEFFYTTDRNAMRGAYSKDSLLPSKMASGFEKAVLTMAFKIALGRAYGLSFAFLDEIDAAAGDADSQKLFESIICSGMFRQMFVISHKTSTVETIKSIAPSIRIFEVSHGKFSLAS